MKHHEPGRRRSLQLNRRNAQTQLLTRSQRHRRRHSSSSSSPSSPLRPCAHHGASLNPSSPPSSSARWISSRIMSSCFSESRAFRARKKPRAAAADPAPSGLSVAVSVQQSETCPVAVHNQPNRKLISLICQCHGVTGCVSSNKSLRLAHLPSLSATTPSGSQASSVNPARARASPINFSASADASPTSALPGDEGAAVHASVGGRCSADGAQTNESITSLLSPVEAPSPISARRSASAPFA